MKLKIAVCDDAAEQKDALCAAVSGWAADRGHEVVLRAFDSAEAFLFHYETRVYLKKEEATARAVFSSVQGGKPKV